MPKMKTNRGADCLNHVNGITPRGVVKAVRDLIDGVTSPVSRGSAKRKLASNDRDGGPYKLAPPLTGKEFAGRVAVLEKQMYDHAENLEFEQAARARDKIEELRADYLVGAEIA